MVSDPFPAIVEVLRPGVVDERRRIRLDFAPPGASDSALRTRGQWGDPPRRPPRAAPGLCHATRPKCAKSRVLSELDVMVPHLRLAAASIRSRISGRNLAILALLDYQAVRAEAASGRARLRADRAMPRPPSTGKANWRMSIKDMRGDRQKSECHHTG